MVQDNQYQQLREQQNFTGCTLNYREPYTFALEDNTLVSGPHHKIIIKTTNK